MATLAHRGDTGFTLVEVLVSFVVLLACLLGSLYAVMAIMEYNLGNSLHEEAVRISQEEMECSRNKALESLEIGTTSVSCTTGAPSIYRQFRSSTVAFTTTRTVAGDEVQKRVTIQVQWTFKKRIHSYSVDSMIVQR